MFLSFGIIVLICIVYYSLSLVYNSKIESQIQNAMNNNEINVNKVDFNSNRKLVDEVE